MMERNNISKSTRLIGLLILISFIYIAFALDWHYSYRGINPLPWIFNPKSVLMFCMGLFMLLIFFPRKPMEFMEKKYKTRCIAMGVFFFLILFIERIFISPYDTPTNIMSYWMLIELPFWGWIGFTFFNTREKAHFILHRLAWLSAIASIVSYLMRLMGMSEYTSFFGPASWPMRFIFLYGFCWFFTRLFFRGVKGSDIFGLIACSTEGIIMFHKPFILGLLFVIPVILLCLLHIKKWKIGILLRLGFIIFWAVGVFTVINYESEGRVFGSYEDMFYKKYLHLEDKYIPDLGHEEILPRLYGGRFELWKQVWPRFFGNPLIGSGLDQVLIIPGGAISMHNGYFDLLLSVGILGVIPIFIFVLWWLRSVYKSSQIPQFSQIQVAIFGYIIGILTISTGETLRLFYSPSFFILFIMGVVLRLSAVAFSD